MVMACVIFFNDGPELLEACLKSLQGKVESILAIDGAFKEFPHEQPYSTDGCLDVAKKWATRVIECKDAWPNQIQKRNAYLNLKSNLDYYFVLDADETFEGEFPSLKDATYGIKILDSRTPELNTDNYVVRLFRHQEGLRYKRKHSWLYAQNKLISIEDHNPDIIKLESPIILHSSYKRPETRQQEKPVYYKERKEPEFLEPPVRDINRPVQLKALEAYSGYDSDCAQIEVKANEIFNVTLIKSKQLLEDFPQQFQIVE